MPKEHHHYVVMAYDFKEREWLVKEWDHFCPWGGIRRELGRYKERSEASDHVQRRKEYWASQGEVH